MKINILDLIDFEKVDILLEGFNKTTGFLTAILDLDGKVLSKSGWRQMCTQFHRINPETSKLCTISDTVLAGKLAEGEKYHFYKCLNGLVDVAVPIVINGEHIANLFSGQFFFEEPNRVFFTKQAEKYGFDQKKYLEALENVPVVSKEKVKTAMDFLLNMTQLISEMTFQKLEQTELNKTIRDSEDKFRSITEQTSDFIFITDSQGIITYASSASVKLFQFDPDEMCGRNFIEFVVEPEIPIALEVFRDASKVSTIVRSIEFSLKRKDGSIFIAEMNGSKFQQDLMNGTLFVLRDITERKRAEAALRGSERKYRTLLENSCTYIHILDRDGVFQMINTSAAALYGGRPADFVGKSMFDVNSKVVADEYYESNRKIIESGVGRNYEKTFKLPGGQKTFLVDEQVIKDDEGVNIALQISSIDITERKLAEEALQKNETELRMALELSNRARKSLLSVLEDQRIVDREIQKLNAELEQRVKQRTAQLEAANKELETFTYSVSHDLKAPLRGIDGYSKLLLDIHSENLNEEAKAFISTIRSSIMQMNQLIEDLLEYSRLERSNLRNEKVRLRKLIDSITSLFKNDLRNGEFVFKLDIPDVELMTDEKGLTIVLRNILENAIKFTKEKSNPSIEIGIIDQPSSLIISVKDNGIGFDMKYHQRIFEIFQRLHRAEDYDGTGIGLAMVSKAMQRMNGKVWAESILGEGSTFYLELPKL